MPDISILLRLSEIMSTTTDYLLEKEENTVTMVTRPEEKKDFSKMMLKVKVSTLKGDKVNVQLPLILIKTMMEKGMEMPEISGKVDLRQFDWTMIMDLVEQGVIGEIVSVDTAEGDKVSIIVE